MLHKQLLQDSYKFQKQIVRWHLADFSDADMLVRPAETANHAAWHLGHLVVALSGLINATTPGAMPPVPEEFNERFGGKGAKLNDGFEPKEQMLARLDQMTDAAVEWVGKLTEADMAKPSPEFMKSWAPTVGALAYALPPHHNMHIGQIQVIRRKLGKPVLF